MDEVTCDGVNIVRKKKKIAMKYSLMILTTQKFVLYPLSNHSVYRQRVHPKYWWVQSMWVASHH